MGKKLFKENFHSMEVLVRVKLGYGVEAIGHSAMSGW